MPKHNRQYLSLSLALSRSLSVTNRHTDRHSHWPRSEHWTTLSWQWQPKGHTGKSGKGISSTPEPCSSSLIIGIIPPLSMLSMAKSQKPLCSKGRAEEVESSRAAHSNSRRGQHGNIFNVDTWENTRKTERNTLNYQFNVKACTTDAV